MAGTALTYAKLQGANFQKVALAGADLFASVLYSSSSGLSEQELLNLQSVKWEPLSMAEAEELKKSSENWFWRSEEDERAFQARISDATKPNIKPPSIKSCFSNATSDVPCEQDFSNDEFSGLISAKLMFIACKDVNVASRLIIRSVREISRMNSKTDTPIGVITLRSFAKQLSSAVQEVQNPYDCPGIAELDGVDKQRIPNDVDFSQSKGQ